MSLVTFYRAISLLLRPNIHWYNIAELEVFLADIRLESLQLWLEQHFEAPVNIELISGDASFRRYFRTTHGSDTFIAVDSPADLVPITPFVELTSSYREQDILVPEIIQSEAKLGFNLLSDLGDEQLGDVLSAGNINHYYHSALQLLPKVAKVKGTNKHPLPIFDDAFIKMELNLFNQWFIEQHLHIKLDSDEQAMLNTVYDFLAQALLTQPQCTMHRDFHSRNIMLHDQELTLIDYQDSVIGPVTYDAVSLLRDCYVVCPAEHLPELQQQHFEQSKQAGIIADNTQFAEYQRWFDLTGLQRHIKIAGIFCRLFYRDAKAGYLKDIPQTLDYILHVTQQYPELADFDHWMKTKIMPTFKQRLQEQKR